MNSTVRFIGLRVLSAVPVLFLVSLGTFFMIDLLPGSAAISLLGFDATPAEVERINEQLGLNDPVWERYFAWIGNALQGDLGESINTPGIEVADAIRQRLPVTLELAIFAQIIAVVLSVPAGMWAAYRAGGRFDRAANATAFGIISIPQFLMALLLVFFLTVQNQLFPRIGWVPISEDFWGNLEHAFLPALSIAAAEVAVYMRLLRSDMISTLQEDYILAARAKGMPTTNVLFRHALRPSSFSLITLAGVNLGRLIGGTIVVESIFNLPGIGSLIVDSIFQDDYTMVQGAVLFVAAAYVIINLFVDLSYAYIDPRIRRGRQ